MLSGGKLRRLGERRLILEFISDSWFLCLDFNLNCSLAFGTHFSLGVNVVPASLSDRLLQRECGTCISARQAASPFLRSGHPTMEEGCSRELIHGITRPGRLCRY